VIFQGYSKGIHKSLGIITGRWKSKCIVLPTFVPNNNMNFAKAMDQLLVSYKKMPLFVGGRINLSHSY